MSIETPTAAPDIDTSLRAWFRSLPRSPQAVFGLMTLGAVSVWLVTHDSTFAWSRDVHGASIDYDDVSYLIDRAAGPRQLIAELYVSGAPIALGALAVVSIVWGLLPVRSCRAMRCVAFASAVVGGLGHRRRREARRVDAAGRVARARRAGVVGRAVGLRDVHRGRAAVASPQHRGRLTGMCGTLTS